MQSCSAFVNTIPVQMAYEQDVAHKVMNEYVRSLNKPYSFIRYSVNIFTVIHVCISLHCDKSYSRLSALCKHIRMNSMLLDCRTRIWGLTELKLILLMEQKK
jgi:hypothetical protein